MRNEKNYIMSPYTVYRKIKNLVELNTFSIKNMKYEKSIKKGTRRINGKIIHDHNFIKIENIKYQKLTQNSSHFNFKFLVTNIYKPITYYNITSGQQKYFKPTNYRAICHQKLYRQIIPLKLSSPASDKCIFIGNLPNFSKVIMDRNIIFYKLIQKHQHLKMSNKIIKKINVKNVYKNKNNKNEFRIKKIDTEIPKPEKTKMFRVTNVLGSMIQKTVRYGLRVIRLTRVGSP